MYEFDPVIIEEDYSVRDAAACVCIRLSQVQIIAKSFAPRLLAQRLCIWIFAEANGFLG